LLGAETVHGFTAVALDELHTPPTPLAAHPIRFQDCSLLIWMRQYQRLVISCRDDDCLSVFTRDIYGNYALAEVMDTPSSNLSLPAIWTDGKPDLIGTGRILWTALSGHTNHATPR